jgi:hypothetical protein
MNFDIFRINWILVDSIIIMILIIILCSVKIYKVKHRWRSCKTNFSIDEIKLDPNFLQFRDKRISIKKWHILHNPKLHETKTSLPTIFLFSSKSLRYLPYAVIEGLCSYGFTVNYILIKRRRSFYTKRNPNFSHTHNNIVSLAYDYIKTDDNYDSLQYWVIDFNSDISYKEIQNDKFNQIGLILINPSKNQNNSRFLSDWFNSNGIVHLIFSMKSYLWFKNRKITRFMKFFHQLHSKNINFDVLEHTNIYFKNYETILLAKLMTIVKDNTN